MSPAPVVSDTEAADLLQQLVSIPSYSGAEAAASQALVNWMGERGFHAQVDEAGNAVGVRGRGDREILLLGHIDTFPGEVPVRREGTLLYGRGTVDAKGPLCAFAVAAARATVPAGWRVTVVGAVEEEAATARGARHIVSSRSGGKGTTPAHCIIGEPSRWDRMVLGYKGRVVLDVSLRTPQTHSAGADPLPAERGVALWRAVEERCVQWPRAQGASGVFAQVTPSLRAISTTDDGSYGNVRLMLGIRVPLHVNPRQVEQALVDVMCESVFGSGGAERRVEEGTIHDVPCRHHRITPDPAAGAGRLELSCTAYGHETAFKAGKSNDLVRAFLAAIRSEGGEPRFVVKTGTADMNVVGHQWPETAILAYGPGDSALDHTPNEHIDLAEYLRSIDVLERVLAGVSGGSSGL